MNNPLFIKQLRNKRGFSQQYLAQQLGISRPTFMQIEKGVSELTVSQAKKLAGIFGITLENFLQEEEGSKTTVVVEKEKKGKVSKVENADIRISVPQKNIDKFKEVLLYILEKVGAKPNVGETVLYKLLYFIDFDYYEKFEEQLIGATYIKNHHGPTPLEFKSVVKDMMEEAEIEQVNSKYFQYEQKKYLPRRESDLSELSAKEIKHIDDVLLRLADKNANELSDYSHNDIPWITAAPGSPIEYEAVFYRNQDTSVREYDNSI